MAFLNGGLKGRQINFTHGAVAHDDVDLMAVFLIVVETEVLHTCCRSSALQSLNIGNHHAGCQQRILAHVLKVAAIQRGAVDVHAGTQDHVLAAITCFLAQATAIEAR